MDPGTCTHKVHVAKIVIEQVGCGMEVRARRFAAPFYVDLIFATSIHLGEGRGVPDNAPPLFHESVRRRMQNLGYKPRARYEPGKEEYVD